MVITMAHAINIASTRLTDQRHQRRLKEAQVTANATTLCRQKRRGRRGRVVATAYASQDQ
jgi:hypothetical protein